MKRYMLAALATLALGAVSCGGDGEGGNPASPSATGGSGSSGSSCNRPAVPGNLAATVSFSTALFSWSPVSGANDYLVMVGTTPGSANALSTNTTQTSYNWSGIPPGTYYARVEARNSCGSGAASNPVTFTVG